MKNDEKQFENLENLSDEELEALDKELDDKDQGKNKGEDPKSQSLEEITKRAEKAERRAATLQRILNKRGRNTETISKNNTNNSDLEKDIAEIKFNNKVDVFARDNSLSRAQAEYVLKNFPNANAEILKDPFVAAGLKAMATKERIQDNTPRGRASSPTSGNKPLSEMTPQEKQEWYQSKMSGN